MKYEKIREAMSLPGFRWMPGMRDDEGVIILLVDDDGTPVEWAPIPPGRALHTVVTGHGSPGWCFVEWEGRILNSHDPATGGCLLELLGPCWSAAAMSQSSDDRFVVEPAEDCGSGMIEHGATIGRGHTLGQACIAAALVLGRWPGGAT